MRASRWLALKCGSGQLPLFLGCPPPFVGLFDKKARTFARS
jgi:hypothetical protein